MLSLRLLGRPQVVRDGAPITIPRRKSRALLYYVAGHTQVVTREALLTIFWPDLARSAAQQTLRTTLHGLRKLLGDDLRVEEDTLALAPGADVDARQLAALEGRSARHAAADTGAWTAVAGSAALSAALDLYRGEFLEGFSLPDADAFEDWVASERERFRRLAGRGLATLAQLREQAGDYAGGLAALDQALSLDPLQEDLQRAALRLHYLSGDRAGAIRRYDQLRRLLDEDLGVPPMAETRALYDQILADQLTAPPPGPPAAGSPTYPRALPLAHTRPHPPARPARLPFVGRAAELRQLLALARREAPGQPALALVEGEPGVGKTRLVEEALVAAGPGGLALAGAARELEQALPYQPLIDALRGLLSQPGWPAVQADTARSLPAVWLAEVARLLPELQPGTAGPGPAAEPDEARLWEGVHQLLLTLARRQPVRLFVDDLQWADASTVALLGYLARRAETEAAPIAYIAATRPVASTAPVATLARGLTREGRLLRIRLERLAPEAVAGLVGMWLAATTTGEAAAAEPLAEWLIEATEGNPYMLAELLRLAADTGLVRPGGDFDAARARSARQVPHAVYDLILSRLARLSDPARRVLDAAVAAGRDFDFEVVCRAAGVSETAGLDALDELRGAGLVRAAEQPGPDRYSFDHTLTMEVAYREAGEARHRRMHRRVAEAMEQIYRRHELEALAGVVAQHFAEGLAPERAAPHALRAGQRAAGLAAWSEAIAFFEMALAAESDAAVRLDTLMALGEAHQRAGRSPQAAEAFRAAVTAAQTLEQAERVEAARLALSRAYLSHARYDEAVRQARQVLDHPASAGGVASAEFAWGAALSVEGVDLEGAAQHLRAAEARLRPAVAAGTTGPARLAEVMFELGGVAAQQGDLERATGLYREALDLAGQCADPEGVMFQVLANNNLAYHLDLLHPGDSAALAYGQAGLRLAREHGLLSLLPYLHSTLGELALARGDQAEAEAQFAEGLALAERHEIPERVAGITANLGRLATARGETAVAIHHLSTALAQADALHTHHLAAQVRLWLAPLLPPAAARTRVAEARALAESGGRQRLLAEALRLQAELGLSGIQGTAP